VGLHGAKRVEGCDLKIEAGLWDELSMPFDPLKPHYLSWMPVSVPQGMEDVHTRACCGSNQEGSGITHWNGRDQVALAELPKARQEAGAL
jgi:hypothetical protein